PGAHSLVQIHAPDQTARRPQKLHCSLDLHRKCAYLIRCGKDSARFSSRLVGPMTGQRPGMGPIPTAMIGCSRAATAVTGETARRNRLSHQEIVAAREE